MSETPALPPPGQLIDIGTHRMHLRSMGEGAPVVVLDAGAGDNLLSWYGIQPEIAKFTRAVSYDRSGLGWSERGTNLRSGATIVRELHDLLVAAEIPAPFVLVGHSMGGVHVRMFAHAYPELVAGLVLVDSSHEQQVSIFGRIVPKVAEVNQQFLDMYRELARKPHEEVVEALLKEVPPTNDPELDALRRDRARPEILTWALEEYDALPGILDQPDTGVHPLGDLPVRVLTGTKLVELLTPEDATLMLTTFQELQRQMAARSSRGVQTLVPDAGHYVHHDQPQVVIDAIREVVEIVRQGV